LAQIRANQMNIILAIDGGGSRTSCLAIDQNGRVAGRSDCGPSNHLLVEKETVVSSLKSAIDEALKQGRLNRDQVICLSAGLAGVDYDGSGAAEMEAIFRAIGFNNLVINGDMVIAHVGALGGRPGVLALAGTGSAILGIDVNGRRVKVGGWGPVYGDEGSAYRIAQSALIAAARAYDGRGPRTELLPVITQALGLCEFRETMARIYHEKMEPREIAELSRAVYETAEEGDGVARKIFLQAGEELAEGVAAALRRLTLTGEQKVVSYQGSVLAACTLARKRFGEHLCEQFPDVSIIPPRASPVIGAYMLGCEALGWPSLVEQVQQAEEF